MARINYTIDGGSATHTSTYDEVYGLLKQIAVQDIINVETGNLLTNVFPQIVVGNGDYLQTIRVKMAKDATEYSDTTFFNDVTLNKPEFVQEFHETWKKIQYNVGYNRKDLAKSLAMGKNEQTIKDEAVANLAKKVDIDDEAYIVDCIFDKSNKMKVVKEDAGEGEVELSTFKTVTTDLKDIIYNIRQVINKITVFNSFGSTLGYETGMTKEDVVVVMSETMSNILDTYLKTGIYNLQYLWDNYTVLEVSDQNYISHGEDLANVYVIDKRHIFTAVRDEVTESQYDAPSQTFGVFYTVDKMYATSGLYKAVYFDCSTAIDPYIED